MNHFSTDQRLKSGSSKGSWSDIYIICDMRGTMSKIKSTVIEGFYLFCNITVFTFFEASLKLIQGLLA